MAQHEEPADRQYERRVRAWHKKHKLEIDAAVDSLLQHSHGRRLLYHYLEISGAVGSNPFTGDSLTTAFRCGEQNVGQQIMAHIIEVSSDGFLTMLKEHEAEVKEIESEQPTENDIGSDENA